MVQLQRNPRLGVWWAGLILALCLAINLGSPDAQATPRFEQAGDHPVMSQVPVKSRIDKEHVERPVMRTSQADNPKDRPRVTTTGSGASLDDPIVIHVDGKLTSVEGIRYEYFLISKLFGAVDILERELIEHDDRKIDWFKLELRDGSTKELFIDCTAFFGKTGDEDEEEK